ncbi:MAG TPA: hypothetical protein VFV27_07680 [Nevskiaceae bacterium]|nr:hypothetical protein [Nevskiaceae bacterium]
MIRRLAVLTAGLILALLFWQLRPAPGPAATAPAAAVAAPAPAGSTLPAPVTTQPLDQEPSAGLLRYRLEQGETREGPALISRREGETLEIEVLSDAANELHLHGYDQRLTLQPGVPARLSRVLDRAGRFELELHQPRHRALAVVEVQPR